MRFLELPFLFAVAGLFMQTGITIAQEDADDFKAASVNVQKVFQEDYKTRTTEAPINEGRIRIEKADNTVKIRMKVLADQSDDARAKIKSGERGEEEVEALREQVRQLIEERVALNKGRKMRYQQSNQQLNQDMIKTMRGILAEIRRFASEHAESADYDAVFDISGTSTNQTPPILFGRDMVDLTSILIAELNKEDSNSGDGR
ncbi:MAG: hypothetical protein QNL68_03230 [Akkermansiaceae bacterium]|jgi:Skp family chaperone for outer membrane proteins